jgi:hypothetical protein
MATKTCPHGKSVQPQDYQDCIVCEKTFASADRIRKQRDALLAALKHAQNIIADMQEDCYGTVHPISDINEAIADCEADNG